MSALSPRALAIVAAHATVEQTRRLANELDVGCYADNPTAADHHRAKVTARLADAAEQHLLALLDAEPP